MNDNFSGQKFLFNVNIVARKLLLQLNHISLSHILIEFSTVASVIRY